MHEGGFFFQALVYLAAMVVVVPIAKKLGLGSVLGYLLAGVIIGPFVLGFIGTEGQDVMHFAEFGVVMMLFLIGLELQPAKIWKLRAPIMGMGGMQVAGTAALVLLLGVFTGLPWQSALAIGFTLALSSTAIVLQTLNEKGLLPTDGGQRAFSVLLFQDIAVIPILAVFPLLALPGLAPASAQSEAGHGGNILADLPVWGQTLVVLGVIAAIILAGRYAINPAFRLLARTRLREVFTAATLLLVIAIAVLMSAVGLSPALGTFLAGVVLAQSEYRHELETDIEPFKGLLLGLFFLSVGASIDFRLIQHSPGLITGLVFGLIAVKLLVLWITGAVFRLSTDNNLLFTFSLAQGGEFAFVLFSYATQNGVLGTDTASPLVAAVAVSMALTPLLMTLNERLLLPRFGTKLAGEREADVIEEQNPVIIAGFGRVGSIIGRFLQAHGVQATYLDIDPDNVDLLRKLGLRVYYGDASRHDLLHAAGAASARLIVIAVDDPDKGYEIAETVRRHYPQLRIIARTRGWRDSYDMLDLGVEDVYRETLDTSLRMGADVLAALGHRRFALYRATHTFRKHDERYVRELAVMRKDSKSLLHGARQRIADLEILMSEEMDQLGRDKDSGWDASSLIEEYGTSRTP